jgi:hypothetical protein
MSLLLTVLLASPDAHAANLMGKWATSTLTLNINPWMTILFPDSVTAMNDVVSDIYHNPSNFYWAVQYDDDTTISPSNGENETSLVANMKSYCGFQADGCMVGVWDSTGVYLQEADVYINSGATWTYGDTRSASWAYSGASRPFKTAFLHELGHAAGLNHTATVYNIMGQDYTHVYVNGNNAYEYLGEDATTGLRNNYGTYGGEDIGVVHWKYSSNDGTYSLHARTTVTSSTGAALATTTSGTETVYKVKRGDTIRFEYTLENNGSNQKIPTLNFYLSTDSTITTADTSLTSTSLSVTPDTPLTTSTSVTISSRQATGTYYLGVLADAANSISEIDENNNYTWTMIQVQ